MAYVVQCVCKYKTNEGTFYESRDVITYFGEKDAQQHAEYANSWAKANNFDLNNNPWDNITDSVEADCSNEIKYTVEKLDIRRKLRPMRD